MKGDETVRTYTLTDRDFEEFYALIEKIETENRLEHGDGPVHGHSGILHDLRRQYRCYFVGWRNRMTSGDTFFHGPEPPRDDIVKHIRWEIERLQNLLPKDVLEKHNDD
jgi:hypothetical protein